MVEELTDNFRRLSLNDPIFLSPEYPEPPLSSRISNLDGTPVPAQGALKRIPDDILYHLFLFMETYDLVESLRTTVKLSHICAQWRAVIIHAPLLWTYVKLPWTRKRINHSQVVESFLRRSQHLPLTLHLVLDLSLEPYILQWARVLAVHAHRFRELIMVVHSAFPIHFALPAILPLKMPHLAYFDFAMFDHRGCTVSMKPRSAEQVASLGSHFTVPNSPTSYLDWTVRNFHITSLSLKYLDLPMSKLFPILIMSQSTLAHLEYYNVTAEDHHLPRITLSKLTSLRVGYNWAQAAWSLVDRLILPNLRSVVVHDFGRCPETRTPLNMQDKSSSPEYKDACELLIALCPFTTVTTLTLRGVTCFWSTFDDVMLPLQYLFQGLQSLILMQCDSQFLHALFDVTMDSRLSELESLSELAITSDDYPLVLDYLRLRTARGLPRLKLFSVNPRMALLRHFYREFASDFHVRGKVHHQPRRESTDPHPYPRESRPRRVPGTSLISLPSV